MLLKLKDWKPNFATCINRQNHLMFVIVRDIKSPFKPFLMRPLAWKRERLVMITECVPSISSTPLSSCLIDFSFFSIRCFSMDCAGAISSWDNSTSNQRSSWWCWRLEQLSGYNDSANHVKNIWACVKNPILWSSIYIELSIWVQAEVVDVSCDSLFEKLDQLLHPKGQQCFLLISWCLQGLW